MQNMRSPRFSVSRSLRLAFLLSLLIVSSVVAETFVSYNGTFNITLPETWEQIDYQTADYYIRQATGNLEYEAVFTAKDSPSVFDGTYVILTIDTTGALDQPRIDSAIGVIVESFGRNLVELPVANFAEELSEAIVGYDRDLQILAVVSDVTEEGSAPRKNVLVQKFYDRGMANFYFYAPDSLLAEDMSSFSELLASFSTEVVRTDTAPVKVADLEAREASDTTSDVILYGGLVVILLCIVLVRVRQRKRK
jgi:hypothetical protein